MDPLAFRAALTAPEARACLTDRQSQAVDAFLRAGTVKGAALALGVSPQAARNLLRYAAAKLVRFARAISD